LTFSPISNQSIHQKTPLLFSPQSNPFDPADADAYQWRGSAQQQKKSGQPLITMQQFLSIPFPMAFFLFPFHIPSCYPYSICANEPANIVIS
jgi:hypothetical protein